MDISWKAAIQNIERRPAPQEITLDSNKNNDWRRCNSVWRTQNQMENGKCMKQ